MKINEVFHALSDPNRRKILELLKGMDMTPSKMLRNLPISPPTLSHHLDILKRAELVKTERRGKNIIYTLNMTVFQDMLGILMDFVGSRQK